MAMAENIEEFILEDFDEVDVDADDGPEDERIDDEVLQDVVGQIRKDVDQAINLITDTLEPERKRAQKYWNGETDLPSAGENRSHYVHTKFRDTVRAVKPDIMRTLMATPRPAEYIPANLQTAELAEQQTDYVVQLFHRMGGYRTIYDAVHTACLHKMGVVKAYYDERKTPRYVSYNGITQEQLAILQQTPDVQVIIDDEETKTIPGPEGLVETTVYNVDVVSFETLGKTRMVPLPPEDFIIDEWATNHSDFRLIGHRRDITVSDAVAMGFDPDAVADLDANDPELNDSTDLSERRRGYELRDMQKDTIDPSRKHFLLTEVYYWADLDQIGVSQLYRFWLGGTSYKYLDHERVDDHPFALFMIDPEPFTVYGKSYFDLTANDQDVSTSIMRSVVDNAHISNNPRLAVHETLVNMEDVLNNEIGAPIRVRGAGQVQPIAVPFTGGNLLPLMGYLDEISDNKTGVTRASVGLDPSALQSTDKNAVQNTIAKQAGQIELAVRNLAETGMVRLFYLLLKITMENPDPVRIMQVRGNYVEAPIDAFNPTLDMRVSVGTGTATFDQRLVALDRVAAEQDKIFAQLGPANPIVSVAQRMNTVQDALEMMGMHNLNRYFNSITPEVEQQLAQNMQAAQQAQQQNQPPDPTQAIIQAEQIKAQTKMQTDTMKNQLDMQKAQAQHGLEMQKAKADFAFKSGQALRQEDLDRDKMLQDLYLRLAEIEAKMGTQVETAQINADVQRQQAATRPGDR